MDSQSNFSKNTLHNRNLKATETRVELLNLLNDFDTAIPFSLIQKSLKNTDRITLYRTIQTFEEKGIIHKAHISNQDTYYALCSEECNAKHHNHNHAHFKCLKCKTVTCEHLSNSVNISIPNFSISNINISVEGVCDNCRKS